MRLLIGLREGVRRSGVDAFYDFAADGDRYATPIELKSPTARSVSTARDVGRTHLVKWRNRVWIIGFYNASGDVLESLLALGPDNMEPRIGRVERYVAPDFAIGERIAHRLALEDLRIICGEKSVYRLDGAQTLQKRQWSKDRYISEMDVTDGYSPDRMLHMLRPRAQ